MALAGKVSQLSAALGGATDSLSRRVCTPMSPFALMIRSLSLHIFFVLQYVLVLLHVESYGTWHHIYVYFASPTEGTAAVSDRCA